MRNDSRRINPTCALTRAMGLALPLALAPTLFSGSAPAQSRCAVGATDPSQTTAYSLCPPTGFVGRPTMSLSGPGTYRTQFLGTFTSIPTGLPASANTLQPVIFGTPSAFSVSNVLLSTTGPDGVATNDPGTLYAYADIAVLAPAAQPSALLLNLTQAGIKLITAFDTINIVPATVATTGCAADVTSKVQVTVAKPLQLFGTQLWTEVVTLQNISGSAISGPLQLATNSLSTNARVFGPTGIGTCAGVSGSSLQNINQTGLAADASVKVVLTFTNSQVPSSTIAFTPILLAGGSQL